MGDNSKIEWTDATWNFLLGCSPVSPGCAHCYAVLTCWRMAHNPNPKIAKAFAGLVRKTGEGKLVWTGKINFVEERLTLPLRWKRPRRIFVNSQSDLFHEDVSFNLVDRAFAVMAMAPQHTFQILTKRPARMREYFEGAGIVGGLHGRAWRIREAGHRFNVPIGEDVNFALPLPNVQLGTSVENQKAADERVVELIVIPAAVRFLSCEPLLGAVDVRPYLRPAFCRQCGQDWNERACGPTHAMLAADAGLHWIIAGGESGPKARPMHPDWPRSLRDQCQAAGVPFFFKQWGEWLPALQDRNILDTEFFGVPSRELLPGGIETRRVGKHRAGRELDGRVWDEMPIVP